MMLGCNLVAAYAARMALRTYFHILPHETNFDRYPVRRGSLGCAKCQDLKASIR